MNQKITAMYVVILDNRVILFDTNLKNFWNQLVNLEPESRNYDYYYRVFKKTDIVKLIGKDDKVYILQKLL